MEPEFTTYQKFDDIEQAREMALVLDIHGIPHEIADVFPAYALNVRPEDMETVKKLLGNNDDNNGEEVPDDQGEDYYLYKFTNEELLEVIADADEWNNTDVSLARKILTDKGVAINEAQLDSIHEQREAELHQPAKPQTFLIISGYVLALLGGVFGMAIGLSLYNDQKTLPNGEIIYKYSDNDRSHGRLMFYLGTVVLGTFIVYRIFRK